MQKNKRALKKSLIIAGVILIAGIISVIIFCSFGLNYENNYVSGVVYGDADNDDNEEEIPGIKVTAYSVTKKKNKSGKFLGETFTDENGYFCIHLKKGYPEYDFIVKLEDVDGEKNGSFKSKIEETQYFAFHLERDLKK